MRRYAGDHFYPDGEGGLYELRKAVQKIAPITTGGYQLIIAGSGNAALIEVFILRVERRFENDASPANIERARDLLEDELIEFYRRDIVLCPDDDKSFKVFVAASCPRAKQYEIWVSEHHLLRPVADTELIGWEHEMYIVTARRLYRKDLTLTQAVLAAVQVLAIAEETSNYIKGPLSVAIIRKNGIRMEEMECVQSLVQRLRAFEQHTNYILLACADTSVYSITLQERLDQFAKIVKRLHEQQIDTVLEQSWKKGERAVVDGLERVPPGILGEVRPDGHRVIRHDVHGIEHMVERVNEALKQQQEQSDEAKPSASQEPEE